MTTKHTIKARKPNARRDRRVAPLRPAVYESSGIANAVERRTEEYVAFLKAEMAKEWRIPGLVLKRTDLNIREVRRILGRQSHRDFWAERVMRALVLQGRATMSDCGTIIYFSPGWKAELAAQTGAAPDAPPKADA